MFPISICTPLDFTASFRKVLNLPKNEQLAAINKLLTKVELPESEEEWNSYFGPNSLFEAWSRCSVMQSLYTSNAIILRSWLRNRPGWRVVEIGGGNGKLWSYILEPEDEGELVVVDPNPGVHEQICQQLPSGVSLVPVQFPMEAVSFGVADAVVCSLTLHHLAGADASERTQYGLQALENLR